MVPSLDATDPTNKQQQAIAKTNEYQARIRAMFEPAPLTVHTGMNIGEQSKYVMVDVPERLARKWGTVEILHITDTQFGHVCCKRNRLEEYRDWALDAPNRFVLFGGDMIDGATVHSPGSPWENMCAPQGQIFRFCEIFAPLRHRILGYVGGNHERRAIPMFGDVGALLATLLEIPYSAGQQVIDIRFGKWQPFKVHLYHGRGAARTKGSKINQLNELMKQGDADLYLMGHLHDPMLTYNWRMVSDPGNLCIRLKKVGGMISSSFLEFWGTYAEVAGHLPSDVMMARAVVEPTGHFMLTCR